MGPRTQIVALGMVFVPLKPHSLSPWVLGDETLNPKPEWGLGSRVSGLGFRV